MDGVIKGLSRIHKVNSYKHSFFMLTMEIFSSAQKCSKDHISTVRKKSNLSLFPAISGLGWRPSVVLRFGEISLSNALS